ncbi:MAG: histidinol-phosphatase HisJ family protein [Mobilitalea sp.]
MIIADYHVHSDFSGDSQAPMELMIEQAITLGLKQVCFTDHIDYDYPKPGNAKFTFDLDQYTKKLVELNERYSKRIKVLTGVELGLRADQQERLTSFTARYPFDFVIGSSHVAEGIDPYYPEFWSGLSTREGLNKYFMSIIDNNNLFHNFNIYGHLDYAIRYAPTPQGIKADYSYSDYSDLIDEMLKAILSNEKGIEINTSGYKYGLGFAHPKAEVLKRYLELGGEILTIGSDAHKPEHLCNEFNLVPDLLKNLGYRYYTTFIGGKPTYEKL